MTGQNPRTLIAESREAGTLCARCSNEIEAGNVVSICRDCGAIHHSICWDAGGGCNSYDCRAAMQREASPNLPKLSITHADLAAAESLPTRPAFSASYDTAGTEAKRPRWNRVAVAAFIVSIIGIPLFGLITGLIAVVCGCIALVGHPYGRRGLALGVLGIVIGLFDVVGWSVGLYYYLGEPHMMVSLNQLTIDPDSLNELPERIARAMRANVLVETGVGLRQGLGSGVILNIADGMAHIVTNRHVVDMNYTENTKTMPQDLSSLNTVRVVTVDSASVPATVEWIAPHGVDLAIISAPIAVGKSEEAYWDVNAPPHIGDNVFAVGNPHGLGWTHSAGDISQVRRQTHDGYNIRILQTTAAINPGNSGGGLYDASGRLVGINSMTGDKRFAEGIGFAISLQTLLDLAPERLHLPKKNAAPINVAGEVEKTEPQQKAAAENDDELAKNPLPTKELPVEKDAAPESK